MPLKFTRLIKTGEKTNRETLGAAWGSDYAYQCKGGKLGLKFGIWSVIQGWDVVRCGPVPAWGSFGRKGIQAPHSGEVFQNLPSGGQKTVS